MIQHHSQLHIQFKAMHRALLVFLFFQLCVLETRCQVPEIGLYGTYQRIVSAIEIVYQAPEETPKGISLIPNHNPNPNPNPNPNSNSNLRYRLSGPWMFALCY